MTHSRWEISPVHEQGAVARRRRQARLDVLLAFAMTPLIFTGVILGLVAIAACALVSVALAAIPAALAIAAIGGVFELDRQHAAVRLAAWADDDSMRKEFGGTGWLVDVAILQGEATTGRDRGMLWIEDDRLLFSGNRTSFALGADLIDRIREERQMPGLRPGLIVSLNHRTPAGTLALALDPVEANDLRQASIGTELGRWVIVARSRGGQLPPANLGPEASNGRALLAVTLVGVAYWATAAVGVLAVLATTAGPWPALGVGLAFALIGSSLPTRYVRVYGRAWRDLRRAEG